MCFLKRRDQWVSSKTGKHAASHFRMFLTETDTVLSPKTIGVICNIDCPYIY